MRSSAARMATSFIEPMREKGPGRKELTQAGMPCDARTRLGATVCLCWASERSLPEWVHDIRLESAVGVQRMPVDPDAGIPDLVRRLGDDSKRLMKDEVALAKLELHDSVREGGKGAMYLGISFGVGVLAAVAFTLLLVTIIGRAAGGDMWVGALITGVL